jgi:hypothetical protein
MALTLTDKECLELLWGEYRYRHEHVWRVIFQITAAATVLAAAPYLNIGITKGIDLWVLALPVLATALIAYGIFALNAELKLLSLIRKRYREVQSETLRIEHGTESRFGFTWRVHCYLGFLFVLGVLHVGVTAARWIPYVRSLP